MGLITVINQYDTSLDGYRERIDERKWTLALRGYWDEGRYHGGYISYYIQIVAPGEWVMKSSECHDILHFLTEEDVLEGRLNDDQAQLLCGYGSLEEAQNAEREVFVAALTNAPADMTEKEAARILYAAALRADCPKINESEGGVLEQAP